MHLWKRDTETQLSQHRIGAYDTDMALDWAPPHIPTSFYRVTWSTVTLGFYYGPFRRLTDPTYSWPRPVTLSLPLGYDTPLGYMQREIALDQVQPHIPPHFYRVAWSTVTLGFYYNWLSQNVIDGVESNPPPL